VGGLDASPVAWLHLDTLQWVLRGERLYHGLAKCGVGRGVRADVGVERGVKVGGEGGGKGAGAGRRGRGRIVVGDNGGLVKGGWCVEKG